MWFFSHSYGALLDSPLGRWSSAITDKKQITLKYPMWFKESLTTIQLHRATSSKYRFGLCLEMLKYILQ